MEIQVNCVCESKIPLKVEEFYSDSKNPELIDEILDNRFQNIYCSFCNTHLQPQWDCSFEFTAFDKKIRMLTEEQRFAWFDGQIKLEKDIDRVVFGLDELKEKVLIFNLDLDDIAIEILKFKLISSKKDLQLELYFHEFSDDHLFFYVKSINPGSTDSEIPGKELMKVPAKYYEEIINSRKEWKKHKSYAIIAEDKYVNAKVIDIED